MIDPPALSVSGSAPRQQTADRPPATGSGRPRLPVPAAVARVLVLAVAFVCAACGLVYELELVALASYLTGDSVTQTSVVLSVMVFAMGIGSLAAKRLSCRPVLGFGLLEAALALTGGSSAMALYASFAWFDQSRAALVGFSLLIGVLIGAEVPLLMTLIQRIRRQDAGGAVADLFAADYVGALVGGLAFPFLLLPLLGQLNGALLTGAVNTVAGGAMVLWLFRKDLTGRERALLFAVNALVLALLATAALFAGPFEQAARRAVYGVDVRVAVRTDVQDVVLVGPPGRTAPAGHPGDGPDADAADGTRGAEGADGTHARTSGPVALYLDGRLRASTRDTCHYEALVHPAMNGPRRHVLVLGGGDGLAVREVLRHRDVASVTVVARDPGVLRLGRTDPGLTELNGNSLADPRVRAVAADAFAWVRERAATAGRPYDVVVSDLPGPDRSDTTKLYSQEFYGLAERVLAPGGRLVVRAGAPASGARSFWTVEATVRSAGLQTAPYRVGTGRPGARAGCPREQGYVLAAREAVRPGPPPDGPRLRWLTAATVRDAVRGTSARRPNGLPPSTLMHPRYTD